MNNNTNQPPPACGGSSDEPTPILPATTGCPYHQATADNGGEGIALASPQQADPRQLPHPTQKAPLPTMRVTSSIPKAPKNTPPAAGAPSPSPSSPPSSPSSPSSPSPPSPSPPSPSPSSASSPPTTPNAEQQQQQEEKWVYPSPQMFYNAMKRKGYSPSEEDMRTVVMIHNTVNEQVWQHILRWEKLHCDSCPTPKLKSFSGHYSKLSPKARYRMWFKGDARPFDRHDWIVDRCGQEVRYIIDFYTAAPAPGKEIAMHLDVRPAIDTFGALWDRLRVFSGLVPRFDDGSSSSSSSGSVDSSSSSDSSLSSDSSSSSSSTSSTFDSSSSSPSLTTTATSSTPLPPSNCPAHRVQE